MKILLIVAFLLVISLLLGIYIYKKIKARRISLVYPLKEGCEIKDLNFNFEMLNLVEDTLQWPEDYIKSFKKDN